MINPYLAAVLWFALAGYILFTAIRRNRTPILFFLSGFLIFLGVWEIIDALNEADLKSGTFGWIYRGVGLAALIVCLLWFFISRRKSQ